ncbi:MAG: glucose-6-phosphate isomerase [Proteobacteria bacterium]|nr:glucose-6-phosphate isomerase [Pseudomonadota bacterium]MBU1736980.1 glucose-6-phosphate isomerase [Pseudomonadota bacterium]
MTSTFQNMDRLPAFTELSRLAENPYRLKKDSTFSRKRLASFSCRNSSLELIYTCQQIDDTTLDSLQQLADQAGAVSQFMAMKRGETMNRIEGFASENRMVQHTATRDLFTDPPFNQKTTGQATTELEKLKHFLADLDSGKIVNSRGESFHTMINIGIGGSDLGPRAIYLALQPFRKNGRTVKFISNVDPDDAASVLSGIDLTRTLVCVVSKSGTTLETLTNESLTSKAFAAEGLKPEEHFIAVTGMGSPMDNPEKYLRSFYMFDYIGGRYSATSMVGGVMLGFALGYDHFLAFLKGANNIDRCAEETSIRRNIPLLLALLGIWNRNFLKHQTLAILPYSQALVRFVAHLQQCDMESNGKSINRQGKPLPYDSGPVIWGEPGTNGQHAFYQLIHQGTTVIPVEFIGFRENQYGRDINIRGTTSQEKLVANLLAQMMALAVGKDDTNPNRIFSGNRPSSLLLADRLDPETMGELLAVYENKIAFQGFIWNINSFDQEGVQLGKYLADRILDRISGRTTSDPVMKTGKDGDVDGNVLSAARIAVRKQQ